MEIKNKTKRKLRIECMKAIHEDVDGGSLVLKPDEVRNIGNFNPDAIWICEEEE